MVKDSSCCNQQLNHSYCSQRQSRKFYRIFPLLLIASLNPSDQWIYTLTSVMFSAVEISSETKTMFSEIFLGAHWQNMIFVYKTTSKEKGFERKHYVYLSVLQGRRLADPLRLWHPRTKSWLSYEFSIYVTHLTKLWRSEGRLAIQTFWTDELIFF